MYIAWDEVSFFCRKAGRGRDGMPTGAGNGRHQREPREPSRTKYTVILAMVLCADACPCGVF